MRRRLVPFMLLIGIGFVVGMVSAIAPDCDGVLCGFECLPDGHGGGYCWFDDTPLTTGCDAIAPSSCVSMANHRRCVGFGGF